MVILIFLILFQVCINLYAEPLLIYNQYPRIWNMDFEKMTSYVPKIKKLGFNRPLAKVS